MKKQAIPLIGICIIGFFINIMLNKCSTDNNIQPDIVWSNVVTSPDKVTRMEVSKEWSEPLEVANWQNSKIITTPPCLINLRISKEKGGIQKTRVFKFIDTKKRISLGNFDFDSMSFRLPRNSKLKKVEVLVFTKSKF